MPVAFKGSLSEFINTVDDQMIAWQLAGISDPVNDLTDAQRQQWMMNPQFRSWQVSLSKMADMTQRAELPTDCGIYIEYTVPSTSRRVDFIVSGKDDTGEDNIVLVELKQWSDALPVEDKPGVVQANTVGGTFKETSHPCYQAQSYRRQLETMLLPTGSSRVRASSCAYMHNYPKQRHNDKLEIEPNETLVKENPLFGSRIYDETNFCAFIKKHVGKGDGKATLELLANGKLVPNRQLIQVVSGMFKKAAPDFFTLVDEQKVAYENIMWAIRQSKADAKKKLTIIVDGGPGSGKSVVAMSAFVRALTMFENNKTKRNVRFVSPTASFKAAMIEMLTSAMKKAPKEFDEDKESVKNLFCSSNGFYTRHPDDKMVNTYPSNTYHILFCDEAHRLHDIQNMYSGFNQVRDIVNAAQISVFFVDDNQALSPTHIGSVRSIEEAAAAYGSEVIKVKLRAQFRCTGAEGYINWVNDALQLEETSVSDSTTVEAINWNEDELPDVKFWNQKVFDFDVVDTPKEVYDFVVEKNKAIFEDGVDGHSILHGARLLAGYAWPWTKEGNKHGEVKDVIVGEGADQMKFAWNNAGASTKWALKDNTFDEVGCVHTSQGLEFDYVGVFIGNDLRYDPETKSLKASLDNYFDIGGKKNLGKGKEEREKNLLVYLCRCYRVLLTRGIHGARVYCEDKTLAEYLKAKLKAVP